MKVKLRICSNVFTQFKEYDVDLIAPGLCIHRNAEGCGELKKDMWTISHVGSGCAVCKDLEDRQTAKKLALKLSKIINWEKFSGNVKRLKTEKFNRIVRLLNKYR